MKKLLVLTALLALGAFGQVAMAHDRDDDHVVVVEHEHGDHAPYWKFHKHYVWVEGHKDFHRHDVVWIPGHYEVERR